MEIISPSAHTELVGVIMAELPAGIQRLLRGVEFTIGVDPVWTGLTPYENTHDNRSYRNTSHVLWKRHQTHLPLCRRETTVCLLSGDDRDREVILHELGHALDERIGWKRPLIKPLDSYAATNDDEAFATAFQSWATTDKRDWHYFHNRARLHAIDPDAVAFFDSLRS